MNMGGIIAAISGAAICMFGSSKKKSTDAGEKVSPEFESGRKLGYEDGLREGMNLRIQRAVGVTRKEYEDLIHYLVSRGLVISYSQSFQQDGFSCGLIVRKDNTLLVPYQLDFQTYPKIK